ncbi:hypothetical protein Tco_0783953 [Tanacetum coccineum]
MRTIQKAHDATLDDGVVLIQEVVGYFFLNWSSRSHVNSGPLLEFHRTLTNGIRLRFNHLTSRPTISTGWTPWNGIRTLLNSSGGQAFSVISLCRSERLASFADLDEFSWSLEISSGSEYLQLLQLQFQQTESVERPFIHNVLRMVRPWGLRDSYLLYENSD